MKVKAIIVAALFSVATPALVLAQAQAPATPSDQSAAPAAGAAMTAPTDFNAFLQGFEGADFTNATSGIDTATSFNVVKLSTLPNADAAQLQTAIEPHQSDIASLSTQIGANAQAKAALDAQSLDVANVVWVSKDASDVWTIYVNDLGAASGDNMAAPAAPAQ